MKLARLLAPALAALSLIVAPIAAQAAAANVVQARTGTEVEGEELRGGFILPLVFLVAVILGIVLLTDGGEEPQSP